jgi:hypothetical protein
MKVAGLDRTLCVRLGTAPIGSKDGRLCFAFSDPELAVDSHLLGLPPHTPYLAAPTELAPAVSALQDPTQDAQTDGHAMITVDFDRKQTAESQVAFASGESAPLKLANALWAEDDDSEARMVNISSAMTAPLPKAQQNGNSIDVTWSAALQVLGRRFKPARPKPLTSRFDTGAAAAPTAGGAGAPTLPIDTLQEARDYLEQNPPTLLYKAVQGTRVEPSPIVVLLRGNTGSLLQALREEEAQARRRRGLIGAVIVTIALLAIAAWFM